MFGMVQSLKKDMGRDHLSKLFKAAAEEFNLQSLDQHTIRVLYQTQRTTEVIALPSSKTGGELLNAKLVVHRGRDTIILNKRGQEIRDWLVRNEEQFGPVTLQRAIRSMRESWEGRPRLTRFTFYSLRWRWNNWWQGTQPQVPMFSKEFLDSLNDFTWTGYDEHAERQAWMEGNFSAFWMCPDGIDAGMEVHDKWLAFLETKPGAVEKEVKRHELAGLEYTPPVEAKPKPKIASSHTTTFYKIYHNSTSTNKAYKDPNTGTFKEVFKDKSENDYNKTMNKIKATKQGPRRLPCGCPGKVVMDTSILAKCCTCGATWIPASRDIRELAQGDEDSLTYKDERKHKAVEAKYKERYNALDEILHELEKMG